MHQDTIDALDILTEALAQNPGDGFDAVLQLDRIPALHQARVSIAQEAAAEARAEAAAARGRYQRTSSRVGRATPNADGHQIGDTVWFKSNTTKYLFGLPVKVIGTNGASVNVDVPDEPRYRRFAGKGAVRCPNAIVTSVNPNP